jgi:hypothetical protein
MANSNSEVISGMTSFCSTSLSVLRIWSMLLNMNSLRGALPS